MEKAEIITRAKAITCVNDLAQLLSDIKTDEFGTTKHKITEKQLLHYCNAKISSNRYKTFSVPKKRGGVRIISSPTYKLSCILHVLNIVLKALYTPRQSTMGFVEGRSVADNGDIHKSHHYVFNTDLCDFFPSIRQGRVWKCLQLKPFNFPEKIASVIAGLCCNITADGQDSVLPQGAATSPLLSNIVCEKLDRRLEGLARRFGLHYSRYADDMTFSSMHNIYKVDSGFIGELYRIVNDQGFVINEAKTRLLKDGRRQEVTGLVVNEKVNVTKKYVRQLRFFLFKWQNEGYAKAYALFYSIYKKDKGYIKKGEPVMENVIGGKLDYLKMVKGENDSTYQTLRQWYNRLQQVVFVDTETDNMQRYVYVQPYKVSEFEQLFGTSLKLEVSKKNKLFARCSIYGKDKTIAISKNSQLSIFPNLASYQEGDFLPTDSLIDCYITLCQQRGRNVKNFWLITRNEPKRSKCLSLQNIRLDSEIIDKLLKIWKIRGIEKASNCFNDLINGGNLLDRTIESISGVTEASFTISVPKSKSELDNNMFLPEPLDFDISEFEDIINGDVLDF